MTGRIFLKLIVAVLGALVLALVAVDFIASRIAEETYESTLRQQLVQKCRILAMSSGQNGSQLSLEALAQAAGGRLTRIDHQGKVLADTEQRPEKMDNHSTRPEFLAALNGQPGSAKRLSASTGVNYLYVAVPAPEGALRLAVPLKEVQGQVDVIRRHLLTATALAFIPTMILTAFLARFVSHKLGRIIDYAAQLAQGNFRARLDHPGTDELGVLGSKLNETGEKLEAMFEQLQREHTELEKLERVRKDFIINVSHELRTPLASIQGYTETLLDGALHDAAHNVRFLNIIAANSERLGRLIADLLTLSRIELGITKFKFASYFVEGLLRDCQESLMPIAGKKQIEIVVEEIPSDADGGPLQVFCDGEAVHQILSNLLDNAIKYTPQGGRIRLRSSIVAGNGGTTPIDQKTPFVRIDVEDTGAGIPAEDLNRLFERFYRVDKARSRELGGTGLGLAIVKHLTRAHAGDVGVESHIGRGSCFFFTLPTVDIGLLEIQHVQPELSVSSPI
jgi:two-component system, OmpR family, phosphate regulon sensor histidine kinase PhoR